MCLEPIKLCLKRTLHDNKYQRILNDNFFNIEIINKMILEKDYQPLIQASLKSLKDFVHEVFTTVPV